MKIALISDLHVNHWTRNVDVKVKVQFVNNILERVRLGHNPDLIVIAGDLWNGSVNNEYDFGKDVIYVSGNHDFYFRNFPQYVNVKYDTVEDVSIATTTLWTNFWGHELEYANKIYEGISDYYHIDGTTTKKVVEAFDQSWEALRALDTEVVITHYPPFLGFIIEEFAGNASHSYFVNDMEDDLLIGPGKTKLWLCGHVHHKHSYVIEGTDILVACNPLGYPGENYESPDDYEPMILERDEDGKWKVTE